MHVLYLGKYLWGTLPNPLVMSYILCSDSETSYSKDLVQQALWLKSENIRFHDDVTNNAYANFLVRHK